ncbi:hypothetical protein DRN44_01855 [Thermococci archaeon]|nr:MAG: hypothetical protein DRN44_01855 [Thermococci archaeon]
MHDLKTEGSKNNKKEDKRFESRIGAFVIIYAVVVGVGVIIESLQTGFRGKLLIDATVGIATILMVGYIALQTKATREMAEEASKQAQLTYEMVKQMVKETALMNESLIEMKKQRLNIEEFKNALLAYLQDLIGALTGNSVQSRNFVPVFSPYMYLSKEYHLGSVTKYLPPSYRGLILRISNFIEKFLEEYEFPTQELREYGELISKFKNSKTPEEERLELARVIPEKSQELLDIVKRIYDGIEEMGDKKLEEEILKILES